MRGVIFGLLPPKCDIFFESPWPELSLGAHNMRNMNIMNILNIMKILNIMNITIIINFMNIKK